MIKTPGVIQKKGYVLMRSNLSSPSGEELFIGGEMGKRTGIIPGATDVKIVKLPVGFTTDGRQLVEEQVAFKLSKANVEKLKKLAERPEQPNVHIEPITSIVPFASTAEFDIAARARSRYIIRLGQIGMSPSTDELLFTTIPAVSGSVRNFFVPPSKSRIVPPIHQSLVTKFRLMYQFARGVQDLHRMGYHHLNITHNSLILSSCNLQPSKVRGFVSDFSLSSGAGISRSGRTSEIRPLPIFSMVSRTDPRYRAPESFLMKQGKDIFPRVPEVANNNYFECTEKTDIFSLGLCFVIMIVGLHPFTYTVPDSPFISKRGKERLLTLARSTDDPDLQFRAFQAECTKWQTFKLFGSTEDRNKDGDDMRWLSVCALVKRGIRRGFLPGITQEAQTKICDLLWGMLFPNPRHRMSIDNVIEHPVFAQFRDEEAKFPRLVDVSSQFIQFAPRTRWTPDKDNAVVSGMEILFKDKNMTHLPFEALFIAFDLASRVAGTFEYPANSILLNASVAAAIRAAILLFDISQSLSYDLANENELSWQILPFIVEYFGGLLRRKDFLFSNLQKAAMDIEIPSEDLLRAVSRLMVEQHGAMFRELYLVLDAPAASVTFASEFSKIMGKSAIRNGSVRGSPASVDVCFKNDSRLAINPPTIAELFYARG